MDKNTITGFTLIGLVVICFAWYGRPGKEELELKAQQDSIAVVQQQRQEQSERERIAQAEAARMAAETDSNALFFARRTGDEKCVVLHNNRVKVSISNRGAAVQEAEIIGYKSRRHEGNVTILGKDNSRMRLTLPLKQDNLRFDAYCFNVASQTDSTVTFAIEQDGKQVQVCYSLRPDSYMLDMSIATTGFEGLMVPGASNMHLDWNATILQQEKGADFENRYSSLTYKPQGEKVTNLSESRDDAETLEQPLEWLAFKNQFFSAVIISEQPMTGVSLSSKQIENPAEGLKHCEAIAQIPLSSDGQPTRMQLYLGPNDFHILNSHNALTAYGSDADLDKLVYLGWSLFRFINRWSILYIFDWLKALGLPMGIVLLLLTVIVKVVVYPTQKKSYMSSAKMRVLKPKIDELNRQFPNQEQALQKQQAMMQLYSQFGVSPMGGCLPMLIQMPVWLALFNFIPNAIDLRGESFLWADDLSAYDDLIRWDADIWLIGNHLSIFCLLFSATNLINSWITMRQQQNQFSGEQAQQMKMMQYMMILMPLMFFFMFNNYSSGLSYYYFVSGLLSILTMWYMRWRTDDARLLASLEAYREKHKNDPKKTSGLQARLEALQKMQQQNVKK